MGKVPSRGVDQFVLRFPEGLRDRIREIAERNGRSMNAEIIMRLENSLIDETFEGSDELKAARAERQSGPPDMSGFYKFPDGVSGEDINRFIRQGIADAFEKAGVVRERLTVIVPEDEEKK